MFVSLAVLLYEIQVLVFNAKSLFENISFRRLAPPQIKKVIKSKVRKLKPSTRSPPRESFMKAFRMEDFNTEDLRSSSSSFSSTRKCLSGCDLDNEEDDPNAEIDDEYLQDMDEDILDN